jgi:hypothetical protein
MLGDAVFDGSPLLGIQLLQVGRQSCGEEVSRRCPSALARLHDFNSHHSSPKLRPRPQELVASLDEREQRGNWSAVWDGEWHELAESGMAAFERMKGRSRH